MRYAIRSPPTPTIPPGALSAFGKAHAANASTNKEQIMNSLKVIEQHGLLVSDENHINLNHYPLMARYVETLMAKGEADYKLQKGWRFDRKAGKLYRHGLHWSTLPECQERPAALAQ